MITADHAVVRPEGSSLIAYSLETGEQTWLCPFRDRIGSASQDRRAKSLLLTSKEVHLWQVHQATSSRTASGHQDTVLAAAMRSGSKQIVAGGMDSEVSIWRLSEDDMLRTRIAHQAYVSAVAVAEGREDIFATAQVDGLIRVWKSAFPKPRRTIPLTAQSQVVVSPDGRHAMTGASLFWERQLQAAQVFDVATGKPAGPPLRPGGLVNGTTFSPDGTKAVTLSSRPENAHLTSYQNVGWEAKPGVVTVWNWKTGQQLRSWSTPSEPVDAEYLPDGARVVILCAGGQVLVTESNSGRVLSENNHEAHATLMWSTPKRRIVVAPSGKYFATLGLGKTVKVWNAKTGRLICSGTHGDQVRDGTFSRDRELFASASMDGDARVWDCRTGRQIANLSHAGWVLSVTFDRDGSRLLTSCRDHTARIWDWQSGAEEFVLRHHDIVTDAAFASDRHIIATLTNDGHISFWSRESGKLLAPPIRGAYWGHTLELMGDGARAITSTGEDLEPVFDVYEIPRVGDVQKPAASADLRLAVELMSGRRIDQGNAVSLTSHEWMERWKAVDRSIFSDLAGDLASEATRRPSK
jgi:WD40 repeat protein